MFGLEAKLVQLGSVKMRVLLVTKEYVQRLLRKGSIRWKDCHKCIAIIIINFFIFS